MQACRGFLPVLRSAHPGFTLGLEMENRCRVRSPPDLTWAAGGLSSLCPSCLACLWVLSWWRVPYSPWSCEDSSLSCWPPFLLAAFLPWSVVFLLGTILYLLLDANGCPFPSSPPWGNPDQFSPSFPSLSMVRLFPQRWPDKPKQALMASSELRCFCWNGASCLPRRALALCLTSSTVWRSFGASTHPSFQAPARSCGFSQDLWSASFPWWDTCGWTLGSRCQGLTLAPQEGVPAPRSPLGCLTDLYFMPVTNFPWSHVECHDRKSWRFPFLKFFLLGRRTWKKNLLGRLL